MDEVLFEAHRSWGISLAICTREAWHYSDQQHQAIPAPRTPPREPSGASSKSDQYMSDFDGEGRDLNRISDSDDLQS